MGSIADAGQALSELIGSGRQAQGVRLALATVRANHATSLDMTYEGGDLDGVPCTLGCTSSVPGDRVVVMFIDHQATAIETMATPATQYGSSKAELVTMTAAQVAAICT